MPHPITIRHMIAKRLRQLRVSYGQQIGQRLNQPHFAALLGIKANSYGAYERADQEPSLEVLVALRRVTGISLDELIAEPGTKHLALESGDKGGAVSPPPDADRARGNRPAPRQSGSVAISPDQHRLPVYPRF